MASGKDYYNILGVGKNASQEEIKQAYRKLARESHPDMVDSSKKEEAEKKFKEINEAYQVLGDPERRKSYDRFGTTDFTGNQGSQGQWGPFTYTYTNGGSGGFGFSNENFDPFDIFEDFFGFRGFGGSRSPKRGRNLHYEMTLDFKEAVFGVEREVSIESGKVHIKIPSGVRSGTELRFTGKGMPGPNNTPPGDLFLTIRVREPSQFRIIEENLYVEVSISFAQAALGTVVDVPVVDLSKSDAIGSTKLKIPGGTQYGARFLIRGKGMPRISSRGQGDVVVQVEVTIPKRINSKQKDLLEKYLNLDL